MAAPAPPPPQEPAPSDRRQPVLWRRLFHLTAGSAAPVLGVFASQETMVVLLSALAGTAIVLEAARFRHPPLNAALTRLLRPLLKRGENRKVTGATYMIIAGLGCFLLFDKGVAVAALLFLSVGDPVAALVGSAAPGRRLWGKSPWGTLAMFCAGASIALVLRQAGVAGPLGPLIVGALAAAIVEALPLPVDDNATVPLISGGAMTLMSL